MVQNDTIPVLRTWESRMLPNSVSKMSFCDTSSSKCDNICSTASVLDILVLEYKLRYFILQRSDLLIQILLRVNIQASVTTPATKDTMRFFVSSLLAILLLSITGVDSFPVVFVTPSSRSATKLSAALIVSSSHPVNDDETTYESILRQARHYAYSDTTTAQEAKQYLRFILELQSDCVAGTVVGTNICDNNITELVDIVANLRQKANQQQLIIARYVCGCLLVCGFWEIEVGTFPTSSNTDASYPHCSQYVFIIPSDLVPRKWWHWRRSWPWWWRFPCGRRPYQLWHPMRYHSRPKNGVGRYEMDISRRWWHITFVMEVCKERNL